MEITIRPETPKDYKAIREVNDAAFKQENEGRLIEKLRKTNRFIEDLSLVAEADNKVVGHILFYPVAIVGSGHRHETLCLGPMALLPEWQRKGIGRRLVEEGLLRAKTTGHLSVVVLGHPEYYPRFGFKKASEFNIKVPFEAPDEAVMAMELRPEAFKGVIGTVEYPRAYLEAV